MPATLHDIGLTKNNAHDFRKMAELPDGDIDDVITEARASGKPARKVDFERRSDAKRKLAAKRERQALITGHLISSGKQIEPSERRRWPSV